jgi:hypothetical protein
MMKKIMKNVASSVKAATAKPGQESAPKTSGGRGMFGSIAKAVKAATTRANQAATPSAEPVVQTPSRPRRGISAMLKKVAAKKPMAMKKGGMADKAGRAMKKTAADARGRAMKKGK